MSSPVVSVLVVSYNQRRFLDDCLNAVLDQSFPAQAVEVLVLDNHSSDGSPQHVVERYHGLQLHEFDSNLGYYGALERGLSKARGRHIIILPADTIIHRDFISELVRVADADPRIAVCMTNTINPHAPDYGMKERVQMPEFMYIPRDTIFGNPKVEQKPLTAKPTRVLLASGVSFLIRREYVMQVGELFDPSFPHYATDLDVALRANVQGWSTVFVPHAIVYHIDDTKSRPTLGLLWRYFIGSRDRLLAFYKAMTTPELLLAIPILFLGIPHKVLVMRSTVGWWLRMALFCCTILLSPLVFLAAVAKFRALAEERRKVLAGRHVGSLWLLRRLVRPSMINGSPAEAKLA
jgi:GT2 family glycosyltransferase